ncbi:acyl carrier protein, partial [Dactylosporangium sp. NPDC005572]|uniref:acyl carrier protein n=1 Tax=Dactylosporangium sp. NPDC005572 TaxID=3156889 RepID=UPI0033AAAE6A
HDPGRVEPDLPFLDGGFNSLMAIELRDRVSVATGLPMPTTLIFEHPTPAALAAHLATVLPADAGGAARPAERAPDPRPDGSDLPLLELELLP